MKTGDTSSGPVPGKEPWATRESRGDRHHEPALTAARGWMVPSKRALHSCPAGVPITSVSMRPLCRRTTKKSAASRASHPGCVAIGPPSPWLSVFLCLCLSLSHVHSLHVLPPVWALTVLKQISVLSASSNVISSAWTAFSPTLSRSYTSFKTQLNYHFFQDALTFLSSRHLFGVSRVPLFLYLDFRTCKHPSKLCLSQ